MTSHPSRSKTHSYLVRAYAGGNEVLTEITAHSAFEALKLVADRGEFASLTTRWQMSPVAADRDNCHAQTNESGTKGWAVRRASVDPRAAEHRNDVEVARAWIKKGMTLAKLQEYGGYASVTAKDVEG